MTDKELKNKPNSLEDEEDWDIVSDVASVHSVATSVDSTGTWSLVNDTDSLKSASDVTIVRSAATWSVVDDNASLQSVPEDRDKSFSFAEIARMNKVFEASKNQHPPLSRKHFPPKPKKEKSKVLDPFYNKFDFDAPHSNMKTTSRKGIKPKYRVTKYR